MKGLSGSRYWLIRPAFVLLWSTRSQVDAPDFSWLRVPWFDELVGIGTKSTVIFPLLKSVNCGANFFIESSSGPANRQIVIFVLGAVPDAAQGATVSAPGPVIFGSAVLPPEGDDEHPAIDSARTRPPTVANRLAENMERPLSNTVGMD